MTAENLAILDNVCQICVFLFGSVAIFLVGRKNKWGFIFGIASQPFWLIVFAIHSQWWMFALSLIYAVNWTVGAYNWFRKKTPANQAP